MVRINKVVSGHVFMRLSRKKLTWGQWLKGKTPGVTSQPGPTSAIWLCLGFQALDSNCLILSVLSEQTPHQLSRKLPGFWHETRSHHWSILLCLEASRSLNWAAIGFLASLLTWRLSLGYTTSYCAKIFKQISMYNLLFF